MREKLKHSRVEVVLDQDLVAGLLEVQREVEVFCLDGDVLGRSMSSSTRSTWCWRAWRRPSTPDAACTTSSTRGDRDRSLSTPSLKSA